MYIKTRDPKKNSCSPNLVSLDRKKGQKTDYKERETDRRKIEKREGRGGGQRLL